MKFDLKKKFLFQFQFIGSDEALEIKFPDKRFIDKAGLALAWCFEIDVPLKH